MTSAVRACSAFLRDKPLQQLLTDLKVGMEWHKTEDFRLIFGALRFLWTMELGASQRALVEGSPLLRLMRDVQGVLPWGVKLVVQFTNRANDHCDQRRANTPAGRFEGQRVEGGQSVALYSTRGDVIDGVVRRVAGVCMAPVRESPWRRWCWVRTTQAAAVLRGVRGVRRGPLAGAAAWHSARHCGPQASPRCAQTPKVNRVKQGSKFTKPAPASDDALCIAVLREPGHTVLFQAPVLSGDAT